MCEKECFHCKLITKCKTCKHCKIAHYCSKECQIQDWKNHRDKCYPEYNYVQKFVDKFRKKMVQDKPNFYFFLHYYLAMLITGCRISFQINPDEKISFRVFPDIINRYVGSVFNPDDSYSEFDIPVFNKKDIGKSDMKPITIIKVHEFFPMFRQDANILYTDTDGKDKEGISLNFIMKFVFTTLYENVPQHIRRKSFSNMIAKMWIMQNHQSLSTRSIYCMYLLKFIKVMNIQHHEKTLRKYLEKGIKDKIAFECFHFILDDKFLEQSFDW